MRPLRELISLDKAKKIIDNRLYQISEKETVELKELINRVSAENLESTEFVPPFRRAAMDGYAILASSTFTATEDDPAILQCIEQVHAGEVPKKSIDESTCIEIATGAMVPESADAVIQVELTNKKENNIYISKPVAPNMNVSKAGADIKKGEIVIKKDQIFTPGRIGVLAALNQTKYNVYRKPKVAVIPTGREVAPLNTPLKYGQVYDINSYTISTLINANGGEAIISDIIEDDFDKLEKTILKYVDTDLIVITGGSSAGERDVTVDIIEKHGEIFFHGVQIKPGKPLLFGRIKDTLVLNLPGYPTSCLTNGYIFMAPALRYMAHLPIVEKKKVIKKISKRIASRLGRHQILTVRVEGDLAIPVFKESGAITSMALADGYIEIPYNLDFIEEGDEVEVSLF